MSIGTYDTKADADRAFAKALSDQVRGSFILPEAGRISLAEYADWWVASRLTSRGEPLRPRVRELYEGQLRLRILPALGTSDLGRLRPATIRAWHGQLIMAGCGASTAAKCYRLLRAILTTAVSDGLIASNPCVIKGGGVEPSTERSIPTPSEVQALARRMPSRFSAMVPLAAFCGLRRGELFGLRRRDIDLLRGTVSIVEQRQQSAKGAELIGPPKTQAGRRTVSLPPSLRPLLEQHLSQFVGSAADALVFTGEKGGPLRPHVWQKAWNRARVAEGLDELHFHDLRHLAGTLAASTGAGAKEIMHRLGHASPQAALRYQHATAERDQAIAAGIDDVITLAGETTEARVIPLRR